VLHDNLLTDELPGRTLRTREKEFLYFSGTSYLGMARNEAFNFYLQEGLKRYGTNYSSSRLSNVQLAVFEEAETYLADYTGAEAAITLSSGFLAGQLVVRTLAGTGSFLYGPGTHPALWLMPPQPTTQDFEAWVQEVPHLIATTKATDVFLLFNSLDPLFAKSYPMHWLQQLPATQKNITLIVDDSHGFGVTGQMGAGIFSTLVVPNGMRKIVVSSLGKALGIPGGVILADKPTIAALRKSSFFGGGSPVVPAYLYAFLRAPEIYQQARAQLSTNIRYFANQTSQLNLFRSQPGYPVFYSPQNQLYSYLLGQDILISSFPYPTPAHDHITRVVLSSLHTQSDLDRLVAGINKFCTETELLNALAENLE